MPGLPLRLPPPAQWGDGLSFVSELMTSVPASLHEGQRAAGTLVSTRHSLGTWHRVRRRLRCGCDLLRVHHVAGVTLRACEKRITAPKMPTSWYRTPARTSRCMGHIKGDEGIRADRGLPIGVHPGPAGCSGRHSRAAWGRGKRGVRRRHSRARGDAERMRGPRPGPPAVRTPERPVSQGSARWEQPSVTART